MAGPAPGVTDFISVRTDIQPAVKRTMSCPCSQGGDLGGYSAYGGAATKVASKSKSKTKTKSKSSPAKPKKVKSKSSPKKAVSKSSPRKAKKAKK